MERKCAQRNGKHVELPLQQKIYIYVIIIIYIVSGELFVVVLFVCVFRVVNTGCDAIVNK